MPGMCGHYHGTCTCEADDIAVERRPRVRVNQRIVVDELTTRVDKLRLIDIIRAGVYDDLVKILDQDQCRR